MAAATTYMGSVVSKTISVTGGTSAQYDLGSGNVCTQVVVTHSVSGNINVLPSNTSSDTAGAVPTAGNTVTGEVVPTIAGQESRPVSRQEGYRYWNFNCDQTGTLRVSAGNHCR